jgi:SAM-dependent methyltransferase
MSKDVKSAMPPVTRTHDVSSSGPPMTKSEVAHVERYYTKNRGYHDELERFYTFAIPAGARVLELGCATGRLLASVRPAYGVGIDLDDEKVRAARAIHQDRKELTFITADVENPGAVFDYDTLGAFDYVILSDLLGMLRDVQATLTLVRRVCSPSTRIVLNVHSNIYAPILELAAKLGQREPLRGDNWLSVDDMKALLRLSGFEPVVVTGRILLPKHIPLVSDVANRVLAKLPVLHLASWAWFIVARPLPPKRDLTGKNAPSVSIVVPTLDEKGNIEGAFARTEPMGSWSELVFVDGGSKDGTVEEIERCRVVFKDKWPRVKVLRQSKKGKGNAVREAFDACEGDVLMILDSDLTMPPEDLPKYYEAIVTGKGELINGVRLVYKMEDEAMRFLNMLANHFFGRLFSYLLDQSVKDTLCGTKVLWKRDYDEIAANREYFGDFDPFGDFDLLFGAARLHKKILDLPIRYRARTYGDIKISRFKHGALLFAMSGVAFRKLKLNT